MDMFNKREDQLGIGLTYDLWRNFPVMESLIFRDLNVGFGVYPDLSAFTVEQGNNDVMGPGGLQIRKDTENTVAGLTKAHGGQGGGIRISNHGTDNHETYLQWGGGGSPFTISTTAKEDRELIFECAFRTSTITATHSSIFIGLAEEGLAAADSMADDSGLMADKDFIGFFSQEDAPAELDIVYRKEGQAQQTVKADWQTLVAATWYRVGMRWNPINKTVSFWFGPGDRSSRMSRDSENFVTAANVAAATFPRGEGLSPFIGLKQSSANATTLDIRPLACAQRSPLL